MPAQVFQTVAQKYPNRQSHVWFQRPDGAYKCAICGGVTDRPTLNDLPERFEPLTDQERVLCPRRGY